MANQNQYIKPPLKDNKNINNDDEYIKPPSKKRSRICKTSNNWRNYQSKCDLW